jgi:hypothetical protein
MSADAENRKTVLEEVMRWPQAANETYCANGGWSRVAPQRTSEMRIE